MGVSPVAWWNDDLPELSINISLDGLLGEARGAGFRSIETGRRFPTEPAVLKSILETHGIGICGGWFSGLLLDGDIEREKERIAPQMALFKAVGAPCIVYGETAGSVQGNRSAPLATRPRLSEDEIKLYAQKMTQFAQWCADQGMPICYHHHMGAPIQSERDVDLLMKHSGEALQLLYDVGHLAFAGGDVLRVIDKHYSRISHVHLKDVNRSLLDGLDWNRDSFLDAVIKGAFSVPGDGSLDFKAIMKRFASYGYEGWFVVEADQDPLASSPLETSKAGHMELLRAMAAAGYTNEVSSR